VRVGMLCDWPVSLAAGRLRFHRPYGAYLDALAPYFEQLVVVGPAAPHARPETEYELASPNVQFRAVPYFETTVGALRVLPGCARDVWRASRACDLLCMTLPTALGVVGYACARLRGIPVVIDLQGDLEAQYERGRYRGVSGWLARAAVWFFERTTQWMVDRCVTMTQGPALREKYGRRSDRIVDLPFSPMSQKLIVDRPDTCQGARVRVLFVGSLLEKKGIFVLLDAVRELRARLPAFVATYVGTGPCGAELAARVEAAGLSELVELRGGLFREADLLAAFDEADVFVLPSYAEGFPRVIFEAMARGVPVVSTRVSGMGGLLADGTDAVLVDPGSPGQLADAIQAVVRDGALRRRLIENGREMACRHSREETVRRRAELIRRAARGDRPSTRSEGGSR
jgi:glycosyltransferase involved in cell wall biosynthesis